MYLLCLSCTLDLLLCCSGKEKQIKFVLARYEVTETKHVLDDH